MIHEWDWLVLKVHGISRLGMVLRFLCRHCSKTNLPSGAKAHGDFGDRLAARLKPCPFKTATGFGAVELVPFKSNTACGMVELVPIQNNSNN